MSRYGSGRGGTGEARREPAAVAPEMGVMDGWQQEFEAAPVWEDNPLCSAEQLQVLQQCRERKNIFFTGSAGAFDSLALCPCSIRLLP